MIKKLTMIAAALAFAAVGATGAYAQDWERAVSLFNQKQYRPALKEFHAVVNANPDYWQAWYYIGAGHFQLQEYEDTIDSFQNYLKGATKDEKGQATASYYIGFAHYQLKQYDKAIPALARYIQLSDKLQQKVDAPARAALGRSYIFTEKYSEAIPVLTTSAAEMKTNATNYYFIGYAQHRLGRNDLAITALNQGLAVAPQDVDTLSLLTGIYLEQTKQSPAAVKQAITTGEKLLAVRNDEKSWGVLGQAYLIDKQYAKAAPLLDKYARAHPDSGPAWHSLGIALSRSSQWKPAAEALEQAVKIAPNNLGALLEMGYVYESDKQYDKALSAYERAYEASGRRDDTIRASIDRVKQYKP
ncbi:MAG TPA: tetratricopeptide repeat protein [Blastocatellia bacterium]|nr:tetratricopeptide repeat protein [Blastocatellia bacterium]